MKTLKLIVLFFALAALSLNYGCGDDNPTPTQEDTMDQGGNDPEANAFKIGIDSYEIETDANVTSAYYVTALDETQVYVGGNDGGAPVSFILKIPGNEAGTFTHSDGAVIDIKTGSGVTEEQFTSEAPQGEASITIADYGAVGGNVKGSFSGKVYKGINSNAVQQGRYEVLRDPDQ